MKKERRTIVVLMLILIISFVASLILEASSFDDEGSHVIVPFLQLPTFIYFLVIVFMIPIIGSIMLGIILPRVLTPIFLKLKKTIWWEFTDAYLETGQDLHSIKRWITRSLLTALLILGLMSVIINIIDPLLFLTPQQYQEFLIDFGYPQYTPPVAISLASLIAPIAFSLWAVSWSLEDAGVIHYKLPDHDESGFVEVEPVHSRYSSYLKGYAGLSSIFFIVMLYFTVSASWENALFILLMPLYSIVQTIPAYLIYIRLDKTYLRNGLERAKQLHEDDIIERKC